MAESCDPLGGWFGVGHAWAHCRGAEEACIVAELRDVFAEEALVKVTPTFQGEAFVRIAPGEFKEYTEDGWRWRVYCDGVNLSLMIADIRICYEEAPIPCSTHLTTAECEAAGCYWYDGSCHSEAEPTPCISHATQAACEAAGCYWYDGSCHGTPEGGYELPLYGSVSALGHTFTNTKLMCDTAQAVIRPEGLLEKTLVVGGAGVIFAVGSLILPGSVTTTGVIMGGIYVVLKEIDEACTKATVEIFNAAYTEEDHDDVVQTVTGDLIAAGFTVGTDPDDDFTPAEVDAATRQAEEKVKNSDEERQRQEDVKNGVKTPEAAEVEREAQIADAAMMILIADNFTLNIPTFVMAGEVVVSGWAPMQSQKIQIAATKKFLGFDFLATDDVLATVTSDAEYKYEATLTLDEFGIIEVYGRIPKDWWAILEKDITTDKHTVFVFTWMMLIALVIIAALVYDKASGGELKKLLKR